MGLSNNGVRIKFGVIMRKYISSLAVFYFLICFTLFAQISNLSKIGVSVEVPQELFPVITKFLSENNAYTNITGIVKWRIQNENEDSVRVTLISEILEWTSPSISTIDLGPHENKELNQTPFGIKLLRKHPIIPSTIILKVRSGETIIYEETKNILIRSVDEMIWSLKSSFDTAILIAAWVTPNDNKVEEILSNAKEKLYERSLSGYQSSDIISQVKAIFNAVRNAKISYVSSTMSFGKIGFTQRVRLPKESISQKSANCIDGTVLFASLFENIGLEPLIVLIPGHAFVGVRLALNSKEILFIETTMVGRPILKSIFTLETTFDAAFKEGSAKYNNAIRTSPSSVHIIDIKKARENGIYPLW